MIEAEDNRRTHKAIERKFHDHQFDNIEEKTNAMACLN